MEPSDGISSTGYCFASPQDVYVLFLPSGGTADLQLSIGSYEVKWFDPRNGGALQDGSVKQLEGCGIVNIGKAPAEADKDWVVLVRNKVPHQGRPCGEPIVLKAIEDFDPIAVNGFAPAYKDESREALAIDAAQYKGQSAATTHTFEHPSGLYDITLSTLLETDGESRYRLKVGDNYLCEFKNPPTEQDYQPSGQTWRNIRIKKGDVIQVEFNSDTNGKIPEGDGTAFSRGRWTTLVFQKICMPE
jgi:hypothetical protein